MPSSDAPSGEGWLESPQWINRARRLGPLRYSDLGPRRMGPPARGVDELAALASWIGTAADTWWEAAGRPDPYTLVVASGDDGQLARSVLAAGPACGRALRYVLVNPDLAGHTEPPAAMAATVALEEPAFLYPSVAGRPADRAPAGPGAEEPEDLDLDLGERPPARGIGPLATFLTDVPALGEAEGAVVAVRLLSRLPYDLYERRDGEWCEVRIAAAAARAESETTSGTDAAGDGADHAPGEDAIPVGLVELTVPAGDLVPTRQAPNQPPAAPENDLSRWRRLTGASDWLRRILPTAAAGVLAVIDDWGPSGDTDSLDLAQLRHVREPQTAQPAAVGGTSLSVVTWRLG